MLYNGCRLAGYGADIDMYQEMVFSVIAILSRCITCV